MYLTKHSTEETINVLNYSEYSQLLVVGTLAMHESQSEKRILKRMIVTLVIGWYRTQETRHCKLQKVGRWSREETTRLLQSHHEI